MGIFDHYNHHDPASSNATLAMSAANLLLHAPHPPL